MGNIHTPTGDQVVFFDTPLAHDRDPEEPKFKDGYTIIYNTKTLKLYIGAYNYTEEPPYSPHGHLLAAVEERHERTQADPDGGDPMDTDDCVGGSIKGDGEWEWRSGYFNIAFGDAVGGVGKEGVDPQNLKGCIAGESQIANAEQLYVKWFEKVLSQGQHQSAARIFSLGENAARVAKASGEARAYEKARTHAEQKRLKDLEARSAWDEVVTIQVAGHSTEDLEARPKEVQ